MSALDALVEELSVQPMRPGDFSLDDFAKRMGMSAGGAYTRLERLIAEGRCTRRVGLSANRKRMNIYRVVTE